MEDSKSVVLYTVITYFTIFTAVNTTFLGLTVEEIVLVTRELVAVFLYFRIAAVFPHYIMLGVKLTQYHLCGVQQQK